ncbi:MAG: DUF1801 domain-containing protein [Pseudomonadota bacterium]
MTEAKTLPTDQKPEDFIATVDHAKKREEGLLLLDLFKEVTGWKPVMWGPSIIGFGRYHYVYDTGREGDMCATGFSVRKAKHSFYIMPGYKERAEILSRLGKHSTGAACLYVNKLADIDIDVLRELIVDGLEDLKSKYKVFPK